jgi:hypothetical protein
MVPLPLSIENGTVVFVTFLVFSPFCPLFAPLLVGAPAGAPTDQILSHDPFIQQLLTTCSSTLHALGLYIFEFNNKHHHSFASNLAKGN